MIFFVERIVLEGLTGIHPFRGIRSWGRGNSNAFNVMVRSIRRINGHVVFFALEIK